MEPTAESHAALAPALPPERDYRKLQTVRSAGLIFGVMFIVGLPIGIVGHRLWERAAAQSNTAAANEKIIGCNTSPTFFTHDPTTGKPIDEIMLCIGADHHVFWTAQKFTEATPQAAAPQSTEESYRQAMDQRLEAARPDHKLISTTKH